jgi:hypothetical protein
MLHRMSRYIPHFIALSASSPFVQGQDTQFDSARLNSVFAFPMSGRAPFTLSWDEFGHFFAKTTRTGVVKSMKDFYWDIRPKPEYGTIEIRVFDTPLTVERAAALPASCSRWRLVPAGAALRAAGRRLHGLHLQPLPGLPLRAWKVGVRGAGHPASTCRWREHSAMTGGDASHAPAQALGRRVRSTRCRRSAEVGANGRAAGCATPNARERLLAEMVAAGAGSASADRG